MNETKKLSLSQAKIDDNKKSAYIITQLFLREKILMIAKKTS